MNYYRILLVKLLCLTMGGYSVRDVEKWMITGSVGRKPTWNVT